MKSIRLPEKINLRSKKYRYLVYLKDEQEDNSNIDILGEFNEPVGFFTFLNLEKFLTELPGIKVDLVSKKALKPRIGKYILQ